MVEKIIWSIVVTDIGSAYPAIADDSNHVFLQPAQKATMSRQRLETRVIYWIQFMYTPSHIKIVGWSQQ